MNKIYGFVLLAFLVSACSSSEKNQEKESLTMTKDVNTSKEEHVVQKETVSNISDKEAKQFLTQWLTSQNESNYENYSNLYASKFEGIKRVGKKEYHYNHDTWLKDRARMFKKTVIVTADDVKVLSSPTVVIVQFTQTWASGSYKDVGPKQLILFKEKEQLKIAKEEMMSSTILGKENADMKLANREKSFLFIKSERYVVLAKSKKKWGNGDYELMNNYTIKQSVNKANVSEYEQWLGRSLYTYDRKGKEEKANIIGLYIISQAQPHFGMVGMYESGDVTIEQYTENLADMAADYAYLVAELDTEEIISYASVHPQTGLSASGKEEKDEILKTELLKLLKETKQYKEYQKEFSEYEEGEWIEKGARTTLTSFDFKAKKYVYGNISAGYGCGDFYGSMAVLWEVINGDFKLVAILNPSENYLNTFSPDYMTDFDNDGEVELWDDDMLIKNDKGEWRDVEYIKAGYFDCPC